MGGMPEFPHDASLTDGPDRDSGLPLAGVESVRDLEQLAARTKTIGTTGMRFQVVSDMLATWVSVMHPAGLGDEVPLVLGLRAQRLAPRPDDGLDPGAWDGLDVVFELDAITERTARMTSQGSTWFPFPPRQLRVPWTAITPPRQGWELRATIDDDDVIAVARNGIDELAQALPANPGESLVARARAQIWSRMLGDLEQVQFPAGAALGAYTLGFLEPGGSTSVHRAGVWTRLTSRRGFILSRRAVAL